MSFQALLFCQDEKTTRTVTQVLSELDFQVEACSETFAAVKKLTSQAFEAVVVDCQNEENAGLLLKTARNSASNQASLMVAVVEGQAGVAAAFRIGANLVLTKPIAIEQARGTLRVARGLLRKNSAPAAGGTPTTRAVVSATAQPVTPAAPAITSAPARSAAPAATPIAAKVAPAQPTISSRPLPPPPATFAPQPSASATHFGNLETEVELQPSPDAASAGLLESLNQKITDPGLNRTAGTRELVSFAEIADTTPPRTLPPSTQKPMARSLEIGGSFGAAAAPARELIPAPIAADVSTITPFEVASPARSETTFTPSEPSGDEDAIFSATPAERSSKTPLLVVAAVLVAAGLAYLGWTQLKGHAPATTTQAPPSAKFSPTFDDSTPPPAQSAAAPTADAHPASQPAAPVETADRFARPAQAIAPNHVSAPTAPKPAQPAPLQVKTQLQRVDTPAAHQEASPEPPSIAGMSGASGTQTLGAITMPNSKGLSAVSLQPQRVSQGVTDGDLVKKVQPVYPTQAVQMHLEGTVVLEATIGKDGSIRNVRTVSGSPVLARAASDAVRQWKYHPSTLNGEPIEVERQISIAFKSPK